MALNRYALLAAAAGMIALSSAPGYAREANTNLLTKPFSIEELASKVRTMLDA